MQNLFWLAFSFFLFIPSAFAATHVSIPPKLSIAVIDFQNKGGVSVENASIVSNRIRAHLSQSGQYRVLERQQIQSVIKEQGFQWGQNCDADNCSATLGKLLNVDYLVLGGVSHLGNIYVVNARRVSVKSGDIEQETFQDCACPLETVLQNSSSLVARALLPALKIASKGEVLKNKEPKIPVSFVTATLAGEGWGGFRNATLGKSQFNAPAGLAFLPSGALVVADQKNHLLRKLQAGKVSSYSGGKWNVFAGELLNAFADGPAATARFHHPTALVASAQGVIYVADTDNHRIRKVFPDGSVITFVGTGEPGFTDGNSAVARFRRPQGLALASDGTLFVADTDNHVIRKVSPHGEVSTLKAGEHLRFPTGLALGVFGGKPHLFIADTFNHSIQMLTLANAKRTGRKNKLRFQKIAGTGEAGFVDGDGLKSQWREPRGLSFVNGTLYVADTRNHRIRRIHLFLPFKVETLVGTGVEGDLNGNPAVGQYQNPVSIVFDVLKQRFVISDSTGNRIRLLTSSDKL